MNNATRYLNERKNPEWRLDRFIVELLSPKDPILLEVKKDDYLSSVDEVGADDAR